MLAVPRLVGWTSVSVHHPTCLPVADLAASLRCRDVVGAALKTLGLSYNSTAADVLRCGLTEEDVRTRVQRLVQQVRAVVLGWARQAL